MSGNSRSRVLIGHMAEVRVSPLRHYTCSKLEHSQAIGETMLNWSMVSHHNGFGFLIGGKLLLTRTGSALIALDVASFEQHFQITEDNPLVGATSRVSLLKSVGKSLLSLPGFFGGNGRPGNLVGR